MNVTTTHIGIICLVIALMNSAMLVIYWRMSPSFKGITWWIGSMLGWSVAFLILCMRLSWTNLWITVLLPNVAIFTGVIIAVRGMCEFRERPFPARTVVALVAMLALCYLPFLFIYPDFIARSAVVSTFMGVFLCMEAWVLLVPAPPHDLRLSHRTAGAIYIFLAMIEWTRLGRTLCLPHHGEVIPMDPFFTFVSVVQGMSVTPLSTFALALLMGQRQLADGRRTERELQETRVQLAEQQALRQKQTLLRDLHDGLSGPITAIAMNCRHLISKDNHDQSDEVLQAIRQLSAMSTHEIRSMMQRVGAEELPWSEIQRELHEFATALLTPAKLRLQWDVGTPPHEPVQDAGAASSLTRMVKETIHNILRHSGADEARVAWSFSPDQLQVTVADNGSGLDAARAPGRGTQHLAARASELGGAVEYQSSAAGLTVHLKLALPLALHDPNRTH